MRACVCVSLGGLWGGQVTAVLRLSAADFSVRPGSQAPESLKYKLGVFLQLANSQQEWL